MPMALIPGGARGIGRGVAIRLMERGWDVAVAYRTSVADADSLLKEADRLGRRAMALRADVAIPEDAQRFFQTATDALGPVDALIHAAGPYHRVDLFAETPEGWREMLDTNVSSLFYLSRLVGPMMMERL